MIFNSLPQHCPCVTVTLFVKYFNLYLLTWWNNSKYPLLFQFTAMPRFVT